MGFSSFISIIRSYYGYSKCSIILISLHWFEYLNLCQVITRKLPCRYGQQEQWRTKSSKFFIPCNFFLWIMLVTWYITAESINLAKFLAAILVDKYFLIWCTKNFCLLCLKVVKVDGRTIGNGKVGPITRKLQAIYKKLTEESGVPIQNYLETWKVCNIFLCFLYFPKLNIWT
jgi:hypothetical protein